MNQSLGTRKQPHSIRPVSLPPQRTIVFALLPGFDLLDFSGPWEVFHLANTIATHQAPYRLIAARFNGPPLIPSHAGVSVETHITLSSVRHAINSLVVPACAGFTDSVPDSVLKALRRTTKKAERVLSICGGAILLAHAGLLDGRKAVTHWRACEWMAREFPKINVQSDSIYVQDDKFYTSAGSTAGIDLALAVVEEDLGKEIALSVAKNLVVFVRRQGGQSQYSKVLRSQFAERKPLKELVTFIVENPCANLSLDVLASRVHMSLRNFTRVFKSEVGQTPAAFVDSVRIEVAMRKLVDTCLPLDVVARDSGFGGPDSMRRVFLRVLKVTPSEYRDRFAS